MSCRCFHDDMVANLEFDQLGGRICRNPVAILVLGMQSNFRICLLMVLLAVPSPSSAQERCYFLECPAVSKSPSPTPAPPPPTPAPLTTPPQPVPSQAVAEPTASSPSYNCSLASGADEVAICTNGRLSYLDRQLSGAFKTLENGLNDSSKARLRDEQRSWLRQRSLCYSNEPCLTSAYRSRILQLQNWR